MTNHSRSVEELLELFQDCKNWNINLERNVLAKSVTEPRDVFVVANYRESTKHLIQCEEHALKFREHITHSLLDLVAFHFECQCRFIEAIFNFRGGEIYDASKVFHHHMNILRNYSK